LHRAPSGVAEVASPKVDDVDGERLLLTVEHAKAGKNHIGNRKKAEISKRKGR
jgi:hypothetical protein